MAHPYAQLNSNDYLHNDSGIYYDYLHDNIESKPKFGKDTKVVYVDKINQPSFYGATGTIIDVWQPWTYVPSTGAEMSDVWRYRVLLDNDQRQVSCNEQQLISLQDWAQGVTETEFTRVQNAWKRRRNGLPQPEKQ